MSTQLISHCHQTLADFYLLYSDTQMAHWNVTGPQFSALHALFQTHYEDLETSIDDLAEHIRTLGTSVNGGIRRYATQSSLKEIPVTEDATQILKHLCHNHRQVIDSINQTLQAAQSAGHEVLIDFMIDRLAFHEKALWMLQSSLPQHTLKSMNHRNQDDDHAHTG